MASDFNSAAFAWKCIVGKQTKMGSSDVELPRYLFVVYHSESVSPLAVLKRQICPIEMGSIPRRYGDRPSTDC